MEKVMASQSLCLHNITSYTGAFNQLLLNGTLPKVVLLLYTSFNRFATFATSHPLLVRRMFSFALTLSHLRQQAALGG